MSIVEQQAPGTVWPDTADDLPFSLQRYPGSPVALPDGAGLLTDYTTAAAAATVDEAVAVVDGDVVGNPLYADVLRTLDELGTAELRARATRRDRLLLGDGVTFGGATDMPRRPFPIDLVPRILTATEWDPIARGVEQRTAALTAFLDDIYGQQRIVADRVIPEVVIRSAPGWREAGRDITSGTPRATVMGMDLLRDRTGRWLVLEDNLRIPSGIGYALEARRTMATVLPELTEGSRRRWVSGAPAMLRQALEAAAPVATGSEPTVAVLSSGPSNSAWFEHRMLAAAMKAPLVMPRDLIAVGNRMAILRPDGPRRLDVLYRREGEDGEPLLPQLLQAVRAGGLWMANAVGNGIADDRAVYAYVPAMIRYYLGEQPLLDNVPTRVLADPACAREVLDHLTDFVVKQVEGASGETVVIGQLASAGELERLRAAIVAQPERFVAQELVDFTTHPTLISSRIEPRRVDLRVFTVSRPEPAVLPTPLSRVALTKGSLIVNSSRGGGAKDTWIVD
jgi:carboxylate-amine ligase